MCQFLILFCVAVTNNQEIRYSITFKVNWNRMNSFLGSKTLCKRLTLFRNSHSISQEIVTPVEYILLEIKQLSCIIIAYLMVEEMDEENKVILLSQIKSLAFCSIFVKSSVIFFRIYCFVFLVVYDNLLCGLCIIIYRVLLNSFWWKCTRIVVYFHAINAILSLKAIIHNKFINKCKCEIEFWITSTYGLSKMFLIIQTYLTNIDFGTRKNVRH